MSVLQNELHIEQATTQQQLHVTTTYLAVHSECTRKGCGHARAGLIEPLERVVQEVQTKPLRNTVANEHRLHADNRYIILICKQKTPYYLGGAEKELVRGRLRWCAYYFVALAHFQLIQDQKSKVDA